MPRFCLTGETKGREAGDKNQEIRLLA